MVMRKCSLAEKRQAVGMSQGGLSNRGMIAQMGTHHFLMDHFMQRLQSTGIVDERARSGKPLKTTHREDRIISRVIWYIDPWYILIPLSIFRHCSLNLLVVI